MISIKIKDRPFTDRAQLVNILHFNPEKLSIEEVCAINDELECIYYVKYDENPICLVIDDLKGYFKYSKEKDFNTDDALPLDAMVSVYSITIIIGSVYKTCCDRFYPQIYLKNCMYKKC